jgi:hypothetical protein
MFIGSRAALATPGLRYTGELTPIIPASLEGWQLCGGPKAWDTCGNIAWMVQQAEANGIPVILATVPP